MDKTGSRGPGHVENMGVFAHNKQISYLLDDAQRVVTKDAKSDQRKYLWRDYQQDETGTRLGRGRD